MARSDMNGLHSAEGRSEGEAGTTESPLLTPPTSLNTDVT